MLTSIHTSAHTHALLVLHDGMKRLVAQCGQIWFPVCAQRRMVRAVSIIPADLALRAASCAAVLPNTDLAKDR